MIETLTFPRHRARPGANDGSGALRRLLAVPLLGLLTAGMLVVSPALASAQTTLTVVGTSDVSDSGLVPNLIKPEFQAAYPQFDLNYVGSATGVAIQSAESGNGSPSALIVHAASLENQFVAGGYSYKNQYGNAIFTNDFVLAGPTGDPAGVAANGANNVAEGFADIATAGAAGKATFLSRGGTNTAPGTTVEEHQIWALVHSSGLQPASLSLCVVSSADGGGMAPVTPATLNGQPCPNSGAIIAGDGNNPSWYQITGVNQGKNVTETNACTGEPSGPNSCYVLTDRGTYDYLASGTDPAGSVPNLKIVTRGPQSTGAPGGADALINYFHVYIINPSKPGENVNLTGAEDFVNFLTSQSFQAQLKDYLAHTSDPAGAPFVATASPDLTASGFPHNYRAGGKPATVTGTLTNAEVGYPSLAGKTVTIDEVKGALVIPVASGKTNSSGHYKIKFIPPASGSYEVTTAQIPQVENATLNPIYGDLLSPAATTAHKVTVHAAITSLRATSQGGKALVFGAVEPGTGHGSGTVNVLARALGKKGSFRKVRSERLSASQGHFAVSVPLRQGNWQVEASFQYPGAAVGTSTVNVSVGAAPTSSATLRSVHTRKGKLTIDAALAPAPGPSGGKVVVLGLNTAPGTPATFKVLGTMTLSAGQTSATLHVKAKRKATWLLQVAYVQPHQASSFSKLRAIDVE
jgi:tungstate transport system substrate-binding protein